MRFTAGPTTYELVCAAAGAGSDNGADHEVAEHTATLDFAVVPLSDDQHRLLVVLCEPRLRGRNELPANRAAAATLGWTQTKFNRKLDHLCSKLARAGVRGLRGEPGTLATDRRQRLVDHALASGLVTDGDLGLL